MARLKLDQEMLGIGSLVEQQTGVPVKDCFQEGQMLYLVIAAGWIGKALGRGGNTHHRLQQQLKRRIRLIEYDDDPVEFVRRVISPLRVRSVENEGGMLILRDPSGAVRGMLVGRDGKNLRMINRAVQRFFPVEVKVA